MNLQRILITAFALLGIASLLGLSGRPAAAAAPRPSPDGLAEISGIGFSCVDIQNLSPKLSGRASLQFFGQEASATGLDPLLGTVTLFPARATPVFGCGPSIPAHRSHGSVAAIVTSDLPVDVQVARGWTDQNQTGSLIHGDALPGRRVIVPVFTAYSPQLLGIGGSIPARSLSSVVHVQNTDTEQAAVARISIRDAEGKTLGQSEHQIAPGSSITFDQGPDSPLMALPWNRIGSLEASSETPLAVMSHVDLRGWPGNALAIEGLPEDRAATKLHLPIVGSGPLSTWILLQNPGDAPATVQVHYQANHDASGKSCPAGGLEHAAGPVRIAAGGIAIVPQAPAAASGLGPGCIANARIVSDRPLMAAVLLDDAGLRATTSYPASVEGDAAMQLALPLLRSEHFGSSAIQVVNPQPRPVQVRLQVSLDGDEKVLDCSACTAEIPAGASFLWYLPNLDELRLLKGKWGWGSLVADAPILAFVSESDRAAGTLRSYPAFGICSAEGGPDARRCSRTVYIPQLSDRYDGWITQRRGGALYLPLAWR